VYQLAADCRKADMTRLFIETCTSMAPTPENLHLVHSAAALMRGPLRDGADMNPLRDFVRRIAMWGGDAHDVLAAAGQSLLDEMHDLPRAGLHDAIRRIAQIERDAVAWGARRDMEGNLRTAYAG
jgi:hypothetical protein